MRQSVWCVLMGAATCAAGCGDDGGGDHDAAVERVTVAATSQPAWIHEPIVVTFSAPPAAVSAADVTLTIGGEPAAVGLELAGIVLTVTVDDAVDGFGEVVLAIESDAIEPFETSWEVEPWVKDDGLGAPGAGEAVPVLGFDGREIYAAWAESTSGGQQIHVVHLDRGTWSDIGMLGDAAVLPAIAASGGELWVAWAESRTGTIEAASWDGSSWTPHGSPGPGTLPSLAAGASDLWLAYQSGGAGIPSVELRALDATGWSGGDSIELGGTITGAIHLVDGALAFVEDDSVVARVRSFVWADPGATTEQPAVEGARPPPALGFVRASIARAGDSLYLAHDRWSGHSFSVHVLARDTIGWTPLGGELDVDPPAEARAPWVRIDSGGAPVVAWRESIEAAQRGLLARWDGEAWRIVGGHVWSDDDVAQPVRPVMELWGGRVPVVVWHTVALDGNTPPAVELARFNGPAAAGPGMATRPSILGCSLGTGTPPATLGSTGCFSIVEGTAIAYPGLIPFDLRSELWSDGALKRRWIGLPDGAALTTAANGSLDAPDGTIVVMELAYETTPGQPATRRVMETRFLRRRAGVWEGFSYQWNLDSPGADPVLLDDVESTLDWPLDAGGSHTHSYPSRAQCDRCHHASVGPLLGLRAPQLGRWFDYGGVIAEQVATLEHLGVTPPSSGQTDDAVAAPHDPAESDYRRVRGYLAANCAHCHNPGGEQPTRDLRWETDLAGTNLCGVVTPGDAAASIVHQRVSTRPGMPPLATLQVDPLIVDVLAAWIDAIATCP